jgi:hypothetical protein
MSCTPRAAENVDPALTFGMTACCRSERPRCHPQRARDLSSALLPRPIDRLAAQGLPAFGGVDLAVLVGVAAHEVAVGLRHELGDPCGGTGPPAARPGGRCGSGRRALPWSACRRCWCRAGGSGRPGRHPIRSGRRSRLCWYRSASRPSSMAARAAGCRCPDRAPRRPGRRRLETGSMADTWLSSVAYLRLYQALEEHAPVPLTAGLSADIVGGGPELWPC